MSILKRIPVRYKGELHDVRLINFSVAMDELSGKVPANIRPRDFNGRAMVSMVDVKLREMRAVAMPMFRFDYRHVAFRLLIDDSEFNEGRLSKGIFFLKSFTDKPLVVAGGRLMTDYNLSLAEIEERDAEVVVRKGDQLVKYRLNEPIATPNPELTATIGALDRAYSILKERIRVTRIQREKWPIVPVECHGFENTFFKTAALEGAFCVNETIYYEWLPPQTIES